MELTELPQTVANMHWISALPAQGAYSASTGDAAVTVSAHCPAAHTATATGTTGAVRVHFDGRSPTLGGPARLLVVIGQGHRRVAANVGPPGHIAAASPFAAHAPPATLAAPLSVDGLAMAA